MGVPAHCAPVVFDGQQRVVVFSVHHPGQRVDKGDGVIVIAKRKAAFQTVGGMAPRRQFKQLGKDFRFGERAFVEAAR